MIYEVYRQDEMEDVDDDGIKHVTRYHSMRKKVAFHFMNEKNNIENMNIWRVAICIDNRLCFDIDIPDEDNLMVINNVYGRLFKTEFRIIRTISGGYHLISKRVYTKRDEWLYDECRVLYPILQRKDIREYMESVKSAYLKFSKRDDVQDLSKSEYLKAIAEDFKRSGLYCGYGDFDIMFSINVLMRLKHCIRISKKSKDDNPFEVFL